ncbi:helix-turn-helix domain-containing protein [Bradyrhizobium sp. CCBAU 11434]|uniref:helix-turn-helix domain-containing protein n=1 Tax=Bradyrhizobium sp. CCBAU 11434 TaxID=1630885 RepID=UPI002305F9AB|nr:helix-turn-helix transcriptional regulator [Bradyrhizobium sp. CCBAU 11434]
MPSAFGIEKVERTTPNHWNGSVLIPLVTFSMLLGVGTGGDYTTAYHALRQSKNIFSKPRDAQPASKPPSITSDIENIRSTLDLSMADLARCLGVSRQALYNWLDGGAIKPENLAKVMELKSASDVIAAANLPERALFLRRKVAGGKTLIDIVAGGGSGVEAARALVELARLEAEQRSALAKLFADRKSQNLLGHGIPGLVDKS